MKRIRLFNKQGDMIVCWEDTAKRLIENGWSVDEPSKRQAKTKKSANVATQTDENEV